MNSVLTSRDLNDGDADVTIDEHSNLSVKRLRAEPREPDVDELAREIANQLPVIDLPDLLIEVKTDVTRSLLPFEHAKRGAAGVPFIDYLDGVCDGDRLLRQRQLAFIHEWDYLIDHLGRKPTVTEYSERWRTPRSTVYALLQEHRRLFPGQDDPTGVCTEIWAGVEAQQGEEPLFFVDMERVRVVPVDGIRPGHDPDKRQASG
jgi:hypothetical protein